MQNRIKEVFKESIALKEKTLENLGPKIEEAIKQIIKTIKEGHKILIFGNGGSAADAQHMAAEMVVRYKIDRKGLPAIALTTDTSILTATSNDFGYEDIFSKQIEALGKKGDLAFGISTSGSSKNILAGLKKAKEIGLTTIGLSGGSSGSMEYNTDICITVPSNDTPRVQESHITIIHIICEIIEKELFA